MDQSCVKKLTFCAAHRLMGHEGQCANLHGHNYTVEVTAQGDPDDVGRVVDFAVIKERIGGWLDEHWDHGVVGHIADVPLWVALDTLGSTKYYKLPDNPTAENMAAHLLNVVAPEVMDTTVVKVRVWETETCYAEAVQGQ